jgi:outer membrane protein assembly factor BamD
LAGTPQSAVWRRLAFLSLAGIFLLSAGPANAQLHKKKKKDDTSTSADNSAQPDKVLYDRAVNDIKRGRHEVGRLNLQTLINTYPDSEYLAKAKLLIADSYYKEGGTANMTQAIAGYKDFIVFFPFLPEAPYAQLQVAMGHFQQMEKPDRDRSEAKEAETEFQTFLTKYPKDPLVDKAKQHLREVQEVIAEGDYRIALYYYTKGDRRASAARLIGITKRYPLYSRSDHALWMLGDIFEKSEKKEIAAQYYAQILKNYPLSTMAPEAKTKLVAMKVPVPQADPNAKSWMEAEQNTPKPKVSLVKRPMGLIKSGPGTELRAAARVGNPNLEPEADNSSATDILSGGNSSRIVVGGSGGGGVTTGGTSGIVATVTPGGPKTETGAEGASGATDNSTTGNGAEGNTTAAPPTEGAAPAAQPAPGESSSAVPAVAPGESTSNAAPAAAPAAEGAAATAPAAATTDANGTTPASTDAAKSTDSSTDSTTSSDKSDDKGKESTSKKKKGVRKLVPW